MTKFCTILYLVIIVVMVVLAFTSADWGGIWATEGALAGVGFACSDIIDGKRKKK